MLRFAWVPLVVTLVGCGGGKAASTISVSCSSGTQLVGAASIDILGDLSNGQPKIEFPDPANQGQIGSIVVPPHNDCKVTPG